VDAAATAAGDLGERSALTVGENADVSLMLHVQTDSPGADKKSNWLPAPGDEVFLAMRVLAEDSGALGPPARRRLLAPPAIAVAN
jgi:hypothetical protein